MISSIRAASLLAGRNNAPLDELQVRRAFNTFMGMDLQVTREAVRFEPGSITGFRPGAGEQAPEIVFGPDIYPGLNVINPNASLSMVAAVAHELTHFHRAEDLIHLPAGVLTHVDEALTSLQAILRYQGHLNPHDIRQLVEDAILRLQTFAQAGAAGVA